MGYTVYMQIFEVKTDMVKIYGARYTPSRFITTCAAW